MWIGTDPWPGSGNSHLLPLALIQQLHTQGYFYINQISDPGRTTIWSKECKDSTQIGLGEAFSNLWTNYIKALKISHIRIIDGEDELVTKHDPHGSYTLKMGYIQLNIAIHQREPSWWWRGLLKIRCPLKARIFMWCPIVNKVPTWDTMKRRQLEGPWGCSLCKVDEETETHLFVLCPFVKQLWQECSKKQGQDCIWQGPSIENAWRGWVSNAWNHSRKALLLILSWGARLARNTSIFLDKPTIPEIIAAQGFSITVPTRKRIGHNSNTSGRTGGLYQAMGLLWWGFTKQQPTLWKGCIALSLKEPFLQT